MVLTRARYTERSMIVHIAVNDPVWRVTKENIRLRGIQHTRHQLRMIFLITWSVSAKPVRYSLYKIRYLHRKDYGQHTRDRTSEIVMRRLSAADAESHTTTMDSNLWNSVKVGTRLTAIDVPMPDTAERVNSNMRIKKELLTHSY